MLGEDQFGFRRGKGIRDTILVLRIGLISERTLKTDEKLCARFTHWQKEFHLGKWKKINADQKGRYYRLARKIDQQIVRGSEC